MNNFWKFAEREKKNNFYIYKRLVRERRRDVELLFLWVSRGQRGIFVNLFQKRESSGSRWLLSMFNVWRKRGEERGL